MKISHSRVKAFVNCPYQYKLRYLDHINTLPKGDPQDALILGHAIHTGIEKTVEEAVKEYYAAYPIITDAHVTEAMKLEYWIPKVKDMLPVGEHEIMFTNDDIIGFIDLLVPVGENEYDLYDFKYSNNVKNYVESEQLHIYKYYFEKMNPGKKIRDMYFLFIPKTAIRQKKKNKTNKRDETLREFRNRVVMDMEGKKITFLKVHYDPNKIIDFLTDTKHMVECEDFEKNPTRLCGWCEYQKYCENDDDIDIDFTN